MKIVKKHFVPLAQQKHHPSISISAFIWNVNLCQSGGGIKTFTPDRLEAISVRRHVY